MYMTDHIFTVMPIKHLVNQDCEPTTPHKLTTVTKPSVPNLRVLFFPCVVLKANAHGEKKALIFFINHKMVFGYLFWNPTTSETVTHIRT